MGRMKGNRELGRERAKRSHMKGKRGKMIPIFILILLNYKMSAFPRLFPAFSAAWNKYAC